jgi:cytochrome P450
MSIRNLHLDPEVFPEPEKFQPERWLGEHDVRMHKYLAPFQKGSRDCVGKK